MFQFVFYGALEWVTKFPSMERFEQKTLLKKDYFYANKLNDPHLFLPILSFLLYYIILFYFIIF